MGSGKTHDIAEIKSEVADIKKMVMELYDRLVIPELVIKKVVPTVHVENI